MLAHVSTASLPFASDPEAMAVAAAMLLFGGLVATAMVIHRRRQGRAELAFSSWTALVAAALSLGAAAIHFLVIDDHAGTYPPFGIAFAALATFQAGWGLAVARRESIAEGHWGIVAILVNGGALATWTVSRFIALPFGPHSGETEAIGSLDLAASAMELALINLLVWVLSGEGRRARVSLAAGKAFAVVGVTVTSVVVVTSVAIAAAAEPPPDPVAHDMSSMESMVHPTPTSTMAPIILGPRPSREPTKVRSPAPVPGIGAAPAPSAAPSDAVGTPPGERPSAAVETPAGEPPSAEAPTPEPTARPTRTPAATPRPTPRPATPKPDVQPGVVRFAGGDNQFSHGETANWTADFSEAPGTSEVTFFIIQVVPDGREFEHWREAIPLADPQSTRLTGQADLSIYVHGGAGSYRLRYVRGDELLAEGAFEFVE